MRPFYYQKKILTAQPAYSILHSVTTCCISRIKAR